ESLTRSGRLGASRTVNALAPYCRPGGVSLWSASSPRCFLSWPTRNVGSHQSPLDPTRWRHSSSVLSAHNGRASTLDDDAAKQVRNELGGAGETLSASGLATSTYV